MRVAIARAIPPSGEKPQVREVAYVVARQQKMEALGRVLDMESPASAIVFCRTRREVDELTEVMGSRGYGADALHGGMSQDQRDRVMRRFREGATQLLVATDVAARGLDIGHLSHVVNFDIPVSPDAYVHRVGRTGRAGREGVGITLLEPRETRLLRSIEKVAKRRIPVETLPTVLDVRARQREVTSAAVRGVLEGGEFAPYGVIVAALATDYDIADIAAAAMKLADDATAPTGTDGDLRPPPARDRKAREARPGSRAPRPGKRRGGRSQDGDFVRLFVPLGRRAGMRASDLVGAIVNEASVEPQQIGTIDIVDNFSLVEVREADADAIIDALRRTTIRGKPVKVRREKH